MGDLFTDAARERSPDAPLAVRIRPATLDELVGQRHVLGPGSALRLAIEQDRPPSMILFGPPGTGKTTIARIVAQRTGAVFEELSAVSARVDDVRAHSDAILVGARTVRLDNPRLLVRSDERRSRREAEGLTPTPLKVTVTATGDLDPELRTIAASWAVRIGADGAELVSVQDRADVGAAR